MSLREGPTILGNLRRRASMTSRVSSMESGGWGRYAALSGFGHWVGPAAEDRPLLRGAIDQGAVGAAPGGPVGGGPADGKRELAEAEGRLRAGAEAARPCQENLGNGGSHRPPRLI